MWSFDEKRAPSYLLVTRKYIASFATNMSNFYVSTVPLFHFILTRDQILRIVTFICRSLVQKAKGINSTENSSNLVKYKKIIEKALQTIVPRVAWSYPDLLLTKPKAHSASSTRLIGYANRLFKGEKLDLPPRHALLKVRFTVFLAPGVQKLMVPSTG